MLNLETPHYGFYTPLSQAMTDSDSEEEVHSSSHIHKQQQQQQQQKSRVNNRVPPKSLALYPPTNQQLSANLQHVNGHQPSSYTTNMQNTFRSIRMTDINDHVGSNFSSFNSDYEERNHTDADNVAILGISNGKNSSREPMSPARRCCFFSSILLCIFAVVGFVWLVPCGNTCPAPVDRIKTHNWLNNYTKIEFKGGINIVSGLRSWENNLIFLYRGDMFFPEFKPSNTKRNGIISLIGSSGAVAWYDEMSDEPVAIDCTLLDVDHNGRPDCLVIDEYGELGAINPLSGQWQWRFRQRSVHKATTIDFPIMLPDMDLDGVLELLIVSTASLEQRTKSHLRKGAVYTPAERNYFLILSGKFGTPIGDGFQMHECDYVSNLHLEHAQTVSYTCVRNNTEAQRSKTLAELFALITNKSIVGQKLVPTTTKISQHRHFIERRGPTQAQRNIYSLSGRELIVENRGNCPENCNVTLVLSETRNGNTSVLRNFTTSGMYGMVPPIQWHFKHTEKKMSGFVMKFWEWNTTNANSRQKPLSGKKASNKGNAVKDNQPSKPNKQYQQNHSHNHKSIKPKRSFTTDVGNASKHLLNNYNKMHRITETVILVLFIGADTRIENTSQSNIIQFCRHDTNEPPVCQPDLNNQENSMVIADLDQDGSQELVSYTSTFVKSSDNAEDWKLVTYCRLLRLQSELPAYYSDKLRN